MQAADIPALAIQEPPTDPKATNIVLIAGSNYFKPGEHDYVAGCAVLRDLLKQTPNVAPVLVLDWPKKAETLSGAKAICLFFFDGVNTGFLKDKRMEELNKLAEAGVGFVNLHQVIDAPIRSASGFGNGMERHLRRAIRMCSLGPRVYDVRRSSDLSWRDSVQDRRWLAYEASLLA